MKNGRIGTLQVAERLSAAEVSGSFEALILFGMVDLLVNDHKFSLVRFTNAPEGRRWQFVGSDEVYIVTETGGVRTVYRLAPQQKKAYMEVTIERKPPSLHPKQKQSSRTETYRGLRCALVEQRTQVGLGSEMLSREWRVVDSKAQGWIMRAELQVFQQEQLSSIVLWDTLDMRFKRFPRNLFSIPKDYQILPSNQ